MKVKIQLSRDLSPDERGDMCPEPCENKPCIVPVMQFSAKVSKLTARKLRKILLAADEKEQDIVISALWKWIGKGAKSRLKKKIRLLKAGGKK